jgi:hypothetical protein
MPSLRQVNWNLSTPASQACKHSDPAQARAQQLQARHRIPRAGTTGAHRKKVQCIACDGSDVDTAACLLFPAALSLRWNAVRDIMHHDSWCKNTPSPGHRQPTARGLHKARDRGRDGHSEQANRTILLQAFQQGVCMSGCYCHALLLFDSSPLRQLILWGHTMRCNSCSICSSSGIIGARRHMHVGPPRTTVLT